MRRFRLTWLVCLLLPVTLLLSGCEFPGDSGSGETTEQGGVRPNPGAGQSVGVAPSKTKAPGCAQAGPKVRHWLPAFDDSNDEQKNIRARENPCLPFGDLLGFVNEVIPEKEVPGMAKARVGEFRQHVHSVADRFLAVEDGIECGYQTDGLAIVVYQHSDHPWSVGLVVVVRLSINAAIDAGLCYLGKQIGLDAPFSTRSAGNQPQPEFCGLASQPNDGNENYAVVALGTSTWMCTALRTSPAGLSEVL